MKTVQVHNPGSENWLGRKWSEWLSLDGALMRGNGPPKQAGIYRLRDGRAPARLLYIGEGADVRGRLFQLRNAMNKVAKGGKQGPPHWAGACILHHMQSGAVIQVSWLATPLASEDERKGLECEYIAAHRWFGTGNPDCQFVAMARRGP